MAILKIIIFSWFIKEVQPFRATGQFLPRQLIQFIIVTIIVYFLNILNMIYKTHFIKVEKQFHVENL